MLKSEREFQLKRELALFEAGLKRDIAMAEQARKDEDAASEPSPVMGARKAKDGNHYLPDPARPGKYLMVVRH